MKAVHFSSEPDNVWTITGNKEDGTSIVVARVRVVNGDPSAIAEAFAATSSVLAENILFRARDLKMREMLKQMEWLEFPTLPPNRGSMWECAVCDAFNQDKEHDPDCPLAALLEEAE